MHDTTQTKTGEYRTVIKLESKRKYVFSFYFERIKALHFYHISCTYILIRDKYVHFGKNSLYSSIVLKKLNALHIVATEINIFHNDYKQPVYQQTNKNILDV